MKRLLLIVAALCLAAGLAIAGVNLASSHTDGKPTAVATAKKCPDGEHRVAGHCDKPKQSRHHTKHGAGEKNRHNAGGKKHQHRHKANANGSTSHKGKTHKAKAGAGNRPINPQRQPAAGSASGTHHAHRNHRQHAQHSASASGGSANTGVKLPKSERFYANLAPAGSDQFGPTITTHNLRAVKADFGEFPATDPVVGAALVVFSHHPHLQQFPIARANALAKVFETHRKLWLEQVTRVLVQAKHFQVKYLSGPYWTLGQQPHQGAVPTLFKQRENHPAGWVLIVRLKNGTVLRFRIACHIQEMRPAMARPAPPNSTTPPTSPTPPSHGGTPPAKHHPHHGHHGRHHGHGKPPVKHHKRHHPCPCKCHHRHHKPPVKHCKNGSAGPYPSCPLPHPHCKNGSSGPFPLCPLPPPHCVPGTNCGHHGCVTHCGPPPNCGTCVKPGQDTPPPGDNGYVPPSATQPKPGAPATPPAYSPPTPDNNVTSSGVTQPSAPTDSGTNSGASSGNSPTGTVTGATGTSAGGSSSSAVGNTGVQGAATNTTSPTAPS